MPSRDLLHKRSMICMQSVFPFSFSCPWTWVAISCEANYTEIWHERALTHQHNTLLLSQHRQSTLRRHHQRLLQRPKCPHPCSLPPFHAKEISWLANWTESLELIFTNEPMCWPWPPHPAVRVMDSCFLPRVRGSAHGTQAESTDGKAWYVSLQKCLLRKEKLLCSPNLLIHL